MGVYSVSRLYHTNHRLLIKWGVWGERPTRYFFCTHSCTAHAITKAEGSPEPDPACALWLPTSLLLSFPLRHGYGGQVEGRRRRGHVAQAPHNTSHERLFCTISWNPTNYRLLIEGGTWDNRPIRYFYFTLSCTAHIITKTATDVECHDYALR